MKIIFLSQDGSIHRLIDALKGDIHLAQSEEEVLELLDEVDEDEECLLFLDFDSDQKKIEKFNKSIISNDWITRIIISGEMKVKDFKKHQKGKTAAHGYVLKPFTAEVFKSILNDLEISHLIEEQNLYEEGTKLPELPTTPQGVKGFENASAELDSDDLDDDEDGQLAEGTGEFSAQEFNMSTQVRELVDMHSVKGNVSPFDGQLNESIQAKFDEVFGYEPSHGDESDFEADLSSDEGFSLREDTQDSIALDLNDDSGDEDLDLSGDDGDIDLEADLDLSDDEGEVDLDSEEVLFEDNEEIDLEAIDNEESSNDAGGDLDISLGDDDPDDEVDLDGDDEELDLSGDDDELDLSEEDGELNFGGDDEEIDLDEDSEEVEMSDDLDEELTRLTEERSLPTKEELAEFEEDTGEFEIEPNESNDEMQFDKPDNPTAESAILDDDDDDDFELDDQLQASDSTEEEASEGMSMSDDDQNDELLEFEEEEVETEGELAFSTEPESDESESGSEEEGGLDFNLGAVEEDDEASSSEEESDDSGGDLGAGGFELDGVDDDDMEIEAGGVSASSGDLDLGSDDDAGELDLGTDDDDAGDLDLSGEDSSDPIEEDDDDEFDLGTDAALSADDTEDSSDSDDEGALEFGDDDGDDDDLDLGGDDSDEPESAPAASSDGNSEFNDDELAFDDEEDEELEKTQAINLTDVKASADSEDLADELEDGDDDLDFGEEDDGGLDSAGTSEFESDEELLNDEFGEDTNPTVVMSQEATRDLENMMDEQVTNEFRPQGMEDNETALMDEDDFDLDEGQDEDSDEDQESYEEEAPTQVAEAPAAPVAQAAQDPDAGSLKITPAEDRMPPSFSEGEAVRLQATIRQLREEREELLKEIQDLKRDKKVTESENLGLKAELDEAKIEISILKKRHSSEIDEMKYRLRITDEKKLYAEEKAKKLQKEFDRLQSKVRVDFNHIKQREKELESQLELVKMDTESQVQSRDKKILDLKRKIDQLEFNMENVVIREQKSRDDKVRLEERLERIMKTLRGSIEVLEDDIEFDSETKRNRD